MKKKFKIGFNIRSLIFYGILTLIVAFGFVSYHQQKKQVDALSSEVESLEEEKKEAELELEGAQRMLEYAKSDSYLERMARSIYGWAREDETIYYDEANQEN